MKSILAFIDTTDYRSKIHDVSRLTLSVELCTWRSEKSGGFPYRLLTRGCARICACTFQCKERTFWIAIALSFSSTKRLASTDGYEVSGKFSNSTKAHNTTMLCNNHIDVYMYYTLRPVCFDCFCRGMIATEFLAVLFFHHRPNLCSCPTPATRKSPEWEKERELINPFYMEKRRGGREREGERELVQLRLVFHHITLELIMNSHIHNYNNPFPTPKVPVFEQ